MVPHRVALALQDAGWWVRQDAVWSKANPLPEPVTDRMTRSHEYVFQLGHPDGGGHYFYDADAIREPFVDPRPKDDRRGRERGTGGRIDGHTRPHGIDPRPHAGRNHRSVFSLPTQSYAEAHFATMPEGLVEPLVLAGTSEAGACASCGSPWVREVEHVQSELAADAHQASYGTASRGGRASRKVGVEAGGAAGKGFAVRDARTTGWRPSCGCEDDRVVPCVVLDPFSGAATTGKVCQEHGRSYVGIDLQVEYLALAKRRLGLR